MNEVSILNSSFVTALGDTAQSIEMIEKENISLGKEEILAFDGKTTIPYYHLKTRVQNNIESIYAALKKEVKKATNNLSSEQKKRTCIIVGSSMINWHLVFNLDEFYQNKPYSSAKATTDYYSERLSKELGLSGFSMSIATACTASANAVIEVGNLIKAGVFDYGIAVGLEIASDIMSSGFYAMQLLAKEEIKPFDTNREGIILGESISVLLLGKEPSSWKLLGASSSSNGVNVTSANEDGSDFYEVMQQALENANISPRQITAIKAHATATVLNDQAELLATKMIFSPDTPICAIKPYIGHNVGGCGVVEIGVFMRCVDKGFLPASITTRTHMDENYRVLTCKKTVHEGIFMMNYFGFGGNNTSLIIQKAAK